MAAARCASQDRSQRHTDCLQPTRLGHAISAQGATAPRHQGGSCSHQRSVQVRESDQGQQGCRHRRCLRTGAVECQGQECCHARCGYCAREPRQAHRIREPRTRVGHSRGHRQGERSPSASRTRDATPRHSSGIRCQAWSSSAKVILALMRHLRDERDGGSIGCSWAVSLHSARQAECARRGERRVARMGSDEVTDVRSALCTYSARPGRAGHRWSPPRTRHDDLDHIVTTLHVH